MPEVVTDECKRLKRELAEAERAEVNAKQDLRAAQQDYERKRLIVARIRESIAEHERRRSGLVITEHAMLRYVERVIGISREEIADKVVPRSMRANLAALGSGEFPVDGHRVRIQNGSVVTLLCDQSDDD